MKINLYSLTMASFIGAALFSSSAMALSLSQNSFIAGKTMVVSLKDDSGKDVTAQYNLSYPGSEIKISSFLGKQSIQGIVAGSGYDIKATNIETGASSDFLVSVSPSSFYKLAIISGNNQTVTVGIQPAQPIVIQAQDMYKNGIAGQALAVTMPKGSLSVTTDSQGLAKIPYTAGMNAKLETITVVDGMSSVSVNEKVVSPVNGLVSIKLGNVPSKIDTNERFAVFATLVDSNGISVTQAFKVDLVAYSNSSCTKIDSNVQAQSQMALSGVTGFGGLFDSVVENFYIGVTAGGHSVCSPMITVQQPVGRLFQIVLTQAPTEGKSGVSMFPPPMIQLQDSSSRIVSMSNDSVQVKAFSSSSCSNELTVTGNTVSAVQGKASFNSFKVTGEGLVYLQAVDGNFKSACIGPITLTSNAPKPSGPSIALIIREGTWSNFTTPLLISRDLGQTFVSKTLPSSPSLPPAQVALVSGSNVLVPLSDGGANNSFMLSKNSGDTYTNIPNPMPDTLAFINASLSGNKISLFAYRGPDWGNFRASLVVSEDLGKSFTEVALPPMPNYWTKAIVSGSNILIQFDGGPNVKFFLSKDNGLSFSMINNPFPDILSITDFAISGDEIAILAQHGPAWGSQVQGLAISLNAGETFSNPALPVYPNTSFPERVSISGSDVFLVMTGGNSQVELMSKDLGTHFSPLNLGITDALSFLFSSFN